MFTLGPRPECTQSWSRDNGDDDDDDDDDDTITTTSTTTTTTTTSTTTTTTTTTTSIITTTTINNDNNYDNPNTTQTTNTTNTTNDDTNKNMLFWGPKCPSTLTLIGKGAYLRQIFQMPGPDNRKPCGNWVQGDPTWAGPDIGRIGESTNGGTNAYVRRSVRELDCA